MKKFAKVLATLCIVVLLLVAGAYYGWQYYTTGRFEESTDDAYLKADITAISPKVTGYVTAVFVDDNQPVKKGQPLLQIDDRDYHARVDAAAADIDVAKAAIGNLDAKISFQQAAVEEAEADISATAADQHFAEDEAARYSALVRSGAGTQQRVEQADAALKHANASLIRTRAALESAKRQLGVLESQRAGFEAQLSAKQAALELARIDLENTRILAPSDGVAGSRTVRVGQLVKPGTQVMAVVPLQEVYVVANFKETQLTHVLPGQTVEIAVDSFPDTVIDGHIDSLAPASGSEFSLLPPDNATGNFTKIVQRIPVKILLPANTPLHGRLLPGMSVIATIDTRTHGDSEAGPSGAAGGNKVAAAESARP